MSTELSAVDAARSASTVRLAVVTPTYRPDFALFRELHESVLEFTNEDVMHYAIVPDRDVSLFSRIRSDRLTIRPTTEFVPRRYLSTYAASQAIRSVTGFSWLPSVQAINLRRPWPPIRGWILQQVVKLVAAGSLDVDVVISVDSDVCFIRRVATELFSRDQVTHLYRLRKGVHNDMPDHATWHKTARRILGLPDGGPASSNDYIAPLVALDVSLVRALRDRIEIVGGRDWVDVLTSELHLSEYILYGTYVDEIAPFEARSFASESSRCHSRWGAEPLTAADARSMVESLTEFDVAVHVQSTAGTDTSLRRALVKSARQVVGDDR
jgi:hypothetical protein